LFPEPQNKQVMKLLFLCSYWHGLAKLRLHTDATLEILDDVTTKLGAAFRNFTDNLCPLFSTQELRREAEARQRRQANKKGKNADSRSGVVATRLSKTFNLQTYKFHSLGDYVRTIKTYGTTDSYSTELVKIIFIYFQLWLYLPQ
jgi:hypothetical protein